jgi:hypothetical protein
MVEWLTFCLRVWDRRGDKRASADFLDRLLIGPGDSVTVEYGPGVPRVRLLTVAMKDFAEVDTTADAGARVEAFSAAVRDGLMLSAVWLARQPIAVFRELREAGRITDVFIGGWVTRDQFDLELPPDFLSACGMLGLTVSICTND